MIRRGLFASALVASVLFAAPQAQAAVNFGSISAIINQLNGGSSFSGNNFAFSVNGQQQFSGISGVRNFNTPGSIAQFNNFAGTYNPNPSGYVGYSFTYSVVGNFFNGSARFAPPADNGAAPSQFNQNTAPIPEPGTWAMMIIGMGVIGMTMRRRAAHKAKYFA